MADIARDALDTLTQWAATSTRKPLIIRGARQIGKSTLVELLAKATKLNLLTINFEQQPEMAELFASKDPSKILSLLNLQSSQQIIVGKTILFLDEVQTVAKQIFPALRYFYEDLPELHLIAAGSLLDFALMEAQFSMPVGRIEYLFLGPLNFEEFLVAMNELPLLDFLHNYKINENYPVAIHLRFMELLQNYLIIGGMPEAVASYARNRDFIMAERIKHSILNTYRDDFSKYSSHTAQHRMRKVFNALPALVGGKLKYSSISHDEKSVAIADALEKLELARVIYLVKHSACNGIPLGAEVNEKLFKPLLLDVGLLCTSLGLNILDFTKQPEITLVNAGAVAEQFIGQHLLYLHPSYQSPQLYYWNREKKSSAAELDYVINLGLQIIPIEVKAGKSGTLKSLHYFIKEKSLTLGVKFNAHLPQLTQEKSILADHSSINYQLLSLPLYFVNQLQRLLQQIS